MTLWACYIFANHFFVFLFTDLKVWYDVYDMSTYNCVKGEVDALCLWIIINLKSLFQLVIFVIFECMCTYSFLSRDFIFGPIDLYFGYVVVRWITHLWNILSYFSNAYFLGKIGEGVEKNILFLAKTRKIAYFLRCYRVYQNADNTVGKRPLIPFIWCIIQSSM